jgi:hypothetical protein
MDCCIHNFLYIKKWIGRCVKRNSIIIGEVAIDCLSKIVSERLVYYKHGKIKTYCEGAGDTAAAGEL